jgi:hypothetical protein
MPVSKQPNFFIVGAPKCGTTALSEYLRTHERVFMPSPKEPHYFSTDLEKYRYVLDESAYLALFAEAGDRQTAIGEASVFYLSSSDAIANLRRFRPEAKIVVMLRNPVDMIHALHGQLLYTADEDEADFENAWRLQAARVRGERIPRHCRCPKLLQYRAMGLLGEQLRRLLGIFPQSQVKILLFEDFVADTPAVYAEVLEFLELPPDNRQSFERVNASHEQKNLALGHFLWRPPPLLRQAWLKFKQVTGLKLAPGDLLRAMNTAHRPRRPISDALRAELNEAFRDDIRLLESLLDRSLAHWRHARDAEIPDAANDG